MNFIITLLINLLDIVTRLIFILLIVNMLVSFFMDPFHPFRRAIDRIVDPMLTPIRRLIRPVGMIDFSPLILLIILQVLSTLLRNYLIMLLSR
jgi:YggT family protein